MPIIICSDCKKEMSDAAPACPNCGRPNKVATPAVATVAEKKVSLLLALGILFLPIIFAWFTLQKGYSKKAKIVSFSWLALFFFFYIGSGKGNNNNSVRANSGARQQQSEQVIQVGIRQILSDYKNNEVAADNIYKGNTAQVTGYVSDIKKDLFDNLYVTVGTGADFEIPQVQAFFNDSMNSRLSSLNKGQRITVVCRIDGLMMNVIAKNCIIK